jgi:3-hydroxyisobutyrate dehydrogenase
MGEQREGQTELHRTMTVGFIGLGSQGAPIARRIATAGWPLQVWARRAEEAISALGDDASVASSPAALGAACDLVGICVTADDDVHDVVLRDGAGVLYGMRPGTILVIHSTVAPETVVELDRLARPLGVHVLDGPVSGGPQGATAGTLTIMVGGDAEPLGRARPVFETFASTVAFLGAVGSGQLMKLVNNNLCFANMAMGIHALDMADRLGMDRAVVADLVKASSGASTGFNIVTDETLLRKAAGPTSNVRKDFTHLADILESRGMSGDALLSVSATTADLVSDLARRALKPPT